MIWLIKTIEEKILQKLSLHTKLIIERAHRIYF